MKFYGVVGFGHSVKTSPGVWEEVITEKTYFGDFIRNTRQVEFADKINSDLTLGNSISILMDGYVSENLHAIRFVEWAGALWVVDDAQEERPRVLLRLGGVYNGSRAPSSP